mmetsp:Transcript_15591/g.16849  ORF Transcript_15591/g.16849 Transcript_15591/m.16849 type:complete len:81 (-) Transcript_15591:157-399(-)
MYHRPTYISIYNGLPFDRTKSNQNKNKSTQLKSTLTLIADPLDIYIQVHGPVVLFDLLDVHVRKSAKATPTNRQSEHNNG